MRQGEYDEIAQWLSDGRIDLGFTNMDAYPPQEGQLLFEDRMIAVLPKSHPLAKRAEISLKDLAGEPFLMLDEGKFSVVRRAFEKRGPDAGCAVFRV